MPKAQRTIKQPHYSDKKIESTLEEIYQEDDGTIPDMKNIEHRKKRTGLVIFIFILMFLGAAAGAAWLGFFIFNPADKLSEQQVDVSINLPTKISNGLENEYTITIKNTGSKKVDSSDVELKMPEGFIIASADPKMDPEKKNVWQLGSIDSGTNKMIRVTGNWGAPKGTHDSIRALVSFKPQNFNAEFQKTVIADVTVTETPLEFSLQTQTTDVGTDHTVAYKNVSSQTIPAGTIKLLIGKNFKPIKTLPNSGALQDGSISFPIPELKPSTQGTIKFSGTYDLKPNEIAPKATATFEIKVGEAVLVLADSNPSQQAKQEAQKPVAVANTLLLTLNTDKTELTVQPSDSFTFEIKFTNETDTPLSKSTVILTADTPSIKNKSIFDYTRLNTTGDPDVFGKQLSPTHRLATITWTADKQKDLVSIAPHASILLSGHIYVRTAAELAAVPLNSVAKLVVKLSNDDGVVLVSQPILIKLDSSASTETAPAA